VSLTVGPIEGVMGFAPVTEALRLAQVALSHALQEVSPEWAEHGGLRWTDVARALVWRE
jgi:hypothetical protein